MSRFFSAIKKEVSESLLDYLVLFTMAVLFLIMLGFFQGEKIPTLMTLVAFVFSYIVWGTYHHAREKTLDLKTVIEYILIGFIALFILAITFLI